MCHWLNTVCVTHPRQHTISSKLWQWSRSDIVDTDLHVQLQQTARSHRLRTGFTPDVFYTSEVLAGVVSFHSRRYLPLADICFDTQLLLSPDILLKMLEAGILFRTLNSNQSHFDSSSEGNSPDLRQHVPFGKHQWFCIADWHLRLSRWPLIFILCSGVASFTLTQTQWLGPWPWCLQHLIALWPQTPFLAFSLLILSILCLNTVINLIMTVSGSSSLV